MSSRFVQRVPIGEERPGEPFLLLRFRDGSVKLTGLLENEASKVFTLTRQRLAQATIRFRFTKPYILGMLSARLIS